MDWWKVNSINEWIFFEPKSLGGNVKVELDLFNYATKADLKNAAGAKALKFARKFDLVSL